MFLVYIICGYPRITNGTIIIVKLITCIVHVPSSSITFLWYSINFEWKQYIKSVMPSRMVYKIYTHTDDYKYLNVALRQMRHEVVLNLGCAIAPKQQICLQVGRQW